MPSPRAPPKKQRIPVTFAIFLGKVPPACRVRELKDALQTRDIRPADITWRGRNGFAFLRFTGPVEECDDVLGKLSGLTLQDQPVVVERAKDRPPGASMGEEYYYEDGAELDDTSHHGYSYGPPPPRRKPPHPPKKPRPPITFAVFLGKVPPTCRVRELKEALMTRQIQPADITWRGRSGFAFLRFTNPVAECEGVLSTLEGLSLQGQEVVVERAKDRVEEEEEVEVEVLIYFTSATYKHFMSLHTLLWEPLVTHTVLTPFLLCSHLYLALWRFLLVFSFVIMFF